MNEDAEIATEAPAVEAAPPVVETPPPPPLEQVLADLEARVHSLEATLAALQDTRQLEERITERVVTLLPPPPPPPMAQEIPPPPREISPPPVAQELPPPGPSAMEQALRTSWTFFEVVNDVRGIFRMLFDRRYRAGWLTRVLTVVLLIAILFSGWWFPLSWLPFVDKILDFFLALVLFLMLSREARRYREWRG